MLIIETLFDGYWKTLMDNTEKEVSVEKDPNNQLNIKEIAEAFVENNLQRNIAVRESSIAGEWVRLESFALIQKTLY